MSQAATPAADRAAPPAADAWSVAAYGTPDDLTLGTRAVPAPRAGQLLVRVEAAAVNPLDLKLIAGDMRQVMPVGFPFVPGTDVCGRVVAVGPGVRDWTAGDRVVGLAPAHGTMAAYALCADGPATARAPDGVPAADLAALPEAGMTALAVMRAAAPRDGQAVAIIGATGGIGLLLCQLASQAGARVIATAGPDDEALVRANGARATVDYTGGDAVAAIAERHPGGVPVLVDLIHQGDALLRSADAVADGGTLVSTLVGPDPSAFPRGVHVRYVRLAPEPGDLDRLVAGVAAGALRPNVSATFAFRDVPNAYRAMRDGHVRGKIAVLGPP